MGKQSGLGAGLDSFYEYLLKSYILFGEKEDLDMFNAAYHSIQSYLRRGYVRAAPGAGGTAQPRAKSQAPMASGSPAVCLSSGDDGALAASCYITAPPELNAQTHRPPLTASHGIVPRLLAGLRLVEAGRAGQSPSRCTRWPEPLAAGWRSRQLGPLVSGSWQLPSERDHVLP